MTVGLFRVRAPEGEIRLARGDVASGPDGVLAAGLTIEGLLAGGPARFADAVAADAVGPVTAGSTILAPIDTQEVWAAGVTYRSSRDARVDEAREASIYDRVYEADRPELFFKANPWRVRATGESIAVRRDSAWNVPEPELALVVSTRLEICGYTIGNDVSSRSIEGDNPLYLPQAKVYDGACALGPAIVPAAHLEPPFAIRLVVIRDGVPVVDEQTTTAGLRRTFAELLDYLGRATSFPAGVVVMTGTGIVPASDFTLGPGDVVRIEIEGLGALVNPVVEVGRTRPSAVKRRSPQAGIASTKTTPS